LHRIYSIPWCIGLERQTLTLRRFFIEHRNRVGGRNTCVYTVLWLHCA
jgi:hypothetical protein